MSRMMGFARCLDATHTKLLVQGKLYPIWEVKGDEEMWETRGELDYGLIKMYRNRFDTPSWPEAKDAAKEEKGVPGEG